MLRTNLSTRPFYNERLVHLLVALGAAILLAVTVTNVVRVVALSRRSTELATRVNGDRSEAERLVTEAARIRRGLDAKELGAIAGAAREANGLIDQRTFSWTALFNHLEATLPPDVMLTSVRPSVDGSTSRVSLVVLGRSVEAIDTFMGRLERTGVFQHVVPGQMEPTDDGLQRQVVETVYVADAQPSGTSGKPASAPRSAAASGGQP